MIASVVLYCDLNVTNILASEAGVVYDPALQIPVDRGALGSVGPDRTYLVAETVTVLSGYNIIEAGILPHRLRLELECEIKVLAIFLA